MEVFAYLAIGAVIVFIKLTTEEQRREMLTWFWIVLAVVGGLGFLLEAVR
jgi:hypothetical protein